MARSLDGLITYLLDEIALCGEQGMFFTSLAEKGISALRSIAYIICLSQMLNILYSC